MNQLSKWLETLFKLTRIERNDTADVFVIRAAQTEILHFISSETQWQEAASFFVAL